LHGVTLRIWFGLFLARDGFRVFAGSDVLNTRLFSVTQIAILCTDIAISYYGLVLSFSALVEYDHKTLS
jgi:hypothetical protein